MPLPILEISRRGEMTRFRVSWQFIREDALARSLALALLLVAWFAVTWLSLGVAALLPYIAAALWLRYRRAGATLGDDELDDLI
jgi:hypothetical protein